MAWSFFLRLSFSSGLALWFGLDLVFGDLHQLAQKSLEPRHRRLRVADFVILSLYSFRHRALSGPLTWRLIPVAFVGALCSPLRLSILRSVCASATPHDSIRPTRFDHDGLAVPEVRVISPLRAAFWVYHDRFSWLGCYLKARGFSTTLIVLFSVDWGNSWPAAVRCPVGSSINCSVKSATS